MKPELGAAKGQWFIDGPEGNRYRTLLDSLEAYLHFRQKKKSILPGVTIAATGSWLAESRHNFLDQRATNKGSVRNRATKRGDEKGAMKKGDEKGRRIREDDGESGPKRATNQ